MDKIYVSPRVSDNSLVEWPSADIVKKKAKVQNGNISNSKPQRFYSRQTSSKNAAAALSQTVSFDDVKTNKLKSFGGTSTKSSAGVYYKPFSTSNPFEINSAYIESKLDKISNNNDSISSGDDKVYSLNTERISKDSSIFLRPKSAKKS